MADTNISTTYDPGRSMIQKMPGAAPAGDLSAGLLALLRARRAAAQETEGPSAAAPRGRVGYASAPQRAQTFQPTMGTQQMAPPREEEIRRTVSDPRASPWTKMATGFDPNAVSEKGYRRKDGSIEWEFDSIRPSGSSGGFIGGGAASTLHASANMGGPGPVDALLANRDDYEPLTGMRRFKPAPPAPQKGGKA